MSQDLSPDLRECLRLVAGLVFVGPERRDPQLPRRAGDLQLPRSDRPFRVRKVRKVPRGILVSCWETGDRNYGVYMSMYIVV